jgi:1-acyl-sn-glycerol-3-phosphate acyltransferase
MNFADRLYRTCATALCFGVFGLGGVLLVVLAIPLLLLVPGRSRRQALGRFLVRQLFRFFVGLMRATGVLTLEVHGEERLRGGSHFILANHPSLIDIVILMSLVDRPDCIVKSTLWRNPFTWGGVHVAGFIDNDLGPGLIEAAIASVRRGNDLIVFPEGTRTSPGVAPRFLRGSANIAVRGDIDILPVIITVSEPTLTKGYPWHRVPRRRPHFAVHVLPTLCMHALLAPDGAKVRQARWLTAWLEKFFAREFERYGASVR